MSRESEASRQQALLAAIMSPAGALELRESGARAARGLAAYRANAHALAERALGAALPTVLAMLGDEDFAQLAREAWRDCPPERGDIGEWGDALPAWIAAHEGLSEWPWLADCARLDLALHRCERAADAVFDAGSLALLQDGDPERLRFVPMPGVQVIEAGWPVATIHAAHHGGCDFAAVREALAARRAETALVSRQGWRAVVHRLDAPSAAWWSALADGASLAQALARAGDGFDLAAWLAQALQHGWLKGVEPWHD